MNWRQIQEELQETYPGKKILLLPLGNPKEILCEIEPASAHPDYSIAIAVVEKSAPHWHKVTAEEYEVLKGKVTVYLDGQSSELKVGEKVIIKPGVKHWAESDSGWIKCTSRPGWTPEDHILV